MHLEFEFNAHDSECSPLMSFSLTSNCVQVGTTLLPSSTAYSQLSDYSDQEASGEHVRITTQRWQVSSQSEVGTLSSGLGGWSWLTPGSTLNHSRHQRAICTHSFCLTLTSALPHTLIVTCTCAHTHTHTHTHTCTHTHTRTHIHTHTHTHIVRVQITADHWSFSEQFSIMTIYLKSSMITSNPKVLFRRLHTNTLCIIFLPAIFTCITELQIILTPLDFHPKDQGYISQPHIPPTRPTTMVIS